MYLVDKKLDVCVLTIVLISCLFSSVCLVATIDRIEKARKASGTLSVASAESFLPVNGKISGPRWH